ncbi:DJ-1/PfpI family protein [Sphingomonas sp. ID0503]|uniref:DJ-1/PfpI family protein n=1 Tax=Sphingomonas sp. ID0503 TaxID=3399691 RepID=UPI003AFB75CE
MPPPVLRSSTPQRQLNGCPLLGSVVDRPNDRVWVRAVTWQKVIEGRHLSQAESSRQESGNSQADRPPMHQSRGARAGILLLLSAASLLVGRSSLAADRSAVRQQQSSANLQVEERIQPFKARFERTRPVIAVVGENSGTELTDYVIPYGILRQADIGEVMAVATRSGSMTMRPALSLQPQASVAEFDARYPEGADYVVVPAVVRREDPALLNWIRAQAAKGGTIVSICDGALVVAGSGVLNGHRATAHWATASYRRKHYPQVRWVPDRRYVADGMVVSSAGISAAIPTSLALVDAVAGHARAAAVAAEIGISDWSSVHDSRRFLPKFGRNLSAFAATQYLNAWFHTPQSLGIHVAAGVDEIALALTADAYTRTGRAHAYALGPGPAPIRTLHGLILLPDRTEAASLTRTISVPASKAGGTLDRVLDDIARSYVDPATGQVSVIRSAAALEAVSGETVTFDRTLAAWVAEVSINIERAKNGSSAKRAAARTPDKEWRRTARTFSKEASQEHRSKMDAKLKAFHDAILRGLTAR